MTPEQSAAYINAQVQLMSAESLMMQAEDRDRIDQGLSPANGPDQWHAFLQKWENVLRHNPVISLFNSTY